MTKFHDKKSAVSVLEIGHRKIMAELELLYLYYLMTDVGSFSFDVSSSAVIHSSLCELLITTLHTHALFITSSSTPWCISHDKTSSNLFSVLSTLTVIGTETIHRFEPTEGLQHQTCCVRNLMTSCRRLSGCVARVRLRMAKQRCNGNLDSLTGVS